MTTGRDLQPTRRIATIACGVIVLAVGCGATARTDGEPVDVNALPELDLSKRPTANDPDPATRAGAAADFVVCEHELWQGGWTSDFGPLGDGPNPDAAIDDMIAGEMLGMPDDGYRAVGRDADRVLYTYEVDGTAKASIVVADSDAIKLDTDERWAIEAFASCDPAEFDPATDDEFPMAVWEDATGRVPTSIISSARGPEHCAWETATFLTLDGVGYVADPNGVLGRTVTADAFDGDAELPAEAIDTGYRQADRHLWLAADRATAYIVTDDGIEAWPELIEEVACG